MVTSDPASPEPVPQGRLVKFALTPRNSVSDPVISPDSRQVAYVAGEAQRMLWVHDLDRDRQREIDGTDGAQRPFWSPGSQFIGFATTRELRKISLQGGRPIRLCFLPSAKDGGFFGGSWSPDGRSIVFSCGDPARLYEVPARGGRPKLLIDAAEPEKGEGFTQPHFLPLEAGGRFLLFSQGKPAASKILFQNLETGERAVLASGAYPAYSPSGHILYQSSLPDLSSVLFAMPFSVQTLKATGEAFPIAEDAFGASVAVNSTLVYLNTVTPARPGRPTVRVVQNWYAEFQGQKNQPKPLAKADRHGREPKPKPEPLSRVIIYLTHQTFSCILESWNANPRPCKRRFSTSPIPIIA